MEKCNVDDDLISVSSNSSSTNDQDNDASTPDTPEDDVDVETLFSDIEVLTFFSIKQRISIINPIPVGLLLFKHCLFHLSIFCSRVC